MSALGRGAAGREPGNRPRPAGRQSYLWKVAQSGTRARKPPPLCLGAKSALKPYDNAFAFQPLEAGFKSLKIAVAGGLVGSLFRGCLLMLAIGRPGRRQSIGARIQGIERVSKWGNHA